MRTDPQPPTYEGPSRRLVVAFDVGTTFSGVSYCFLDPGVIPKICSLTKYPGQASGGSSKIPTVMYYDKDGNMKCAGAETQLPENEMNADDEEWIKVDWFKLRLRPKSMPSKLENAKLPPLPTGKNIVQVFADFLGYLMLCTETFIKETYSMVTEDVWKKLQTDMVIVLAHPNGWEGAQQKQMRDAAILAKIIPDKPSGRERVVFVSEGEASLHFCVKGEFIDDAERGFVIADLGGGTLDFSAYKVCGQKPLKVEEMDASKCLLEGSVLVTQRAHVSFRKKLEGSTYGDEKTIAQISDKFDETTKKVFRTKNDTCLVVFGSPRDDDKAYGIRGGRLKLAGEEVAAFFEPSISATVKAIEEHIRASPIKVSAVYMVGGFSASPYLKSEVETRLKSHNIKVATPDGQAVKAVADGAVSFYIDHYVMARVAKGSYGVVCSKFLEDHKADHMKRKATAFVTASGYEYIPGGFATILKKGTVVSEETEFRDHFHREYEMDIVPPAIRSVISVYNGAGDPPDWVDEMAETPRQLCTVVADMTKIRPTEVEEVSREGGRYKSYNYDVLLYFGGPELKAQTAWMENGVEKRYAAL
ncbi:hypothetical protein SCHPADRAFT_915119 [Schizopora paradoxa]|uniref:Actin-like ATPase domain-containing protein n=1 Tax=Schizopora paradoxa TaxID=27342 RepID=A0A0H2RPK4_9AGAM|nr:hypothetical protein SCHPADRAFT_915119 [Schizopora paradoxa]